MFIPSRYHCRQRYSEYMFDDDTVEIHDQFDRKFSHRKFKTEEIHIQITEECRIHTTKVFEEHIY